MRASRRAIAAALILVLTSAFLVALGRELGVAVGPLVMGLLAGMCLAFLATRTVLRRRTQKRPKPRVLAGGRVLGRSYDLAKDKSTDDQRWLM